MNGAGGLVLQKWAPRVIAWLLVLAWMGLIFYLSHQPDLPSPPSKLLNLLLKKTSHASVYAGLAALMWHALARGGIPRPWLFGLSLLIAILYGLSDEYHQSFIPGRNSRLTDVGIDTIGAMLALILLQRFGPRNWPVHPPQADRHPHPGEPG